MSENNLWQLFTDTGDPLCWLYCRAAARYDKKDNEKSTEDKPQALG